MIAHGTDAVLSPGSLWHNLTRYGAMGGGCLLRNQRISYLFSVVGRKTVARPDQPRGFLHSSGMPDTPGVPGVSWGGRAAGGCRSCGGQPVGTMEYPAVLAELSGSARFGWLVYSSFLVAGGGRALLPPLAGLVNPVDAEAGCLGGPAAGVGISHLACRRVPLSVDPSCSARRRILRPH